MIKRQFEALRWLEQLVAQEPSGLDRFVPGSASRQHTRLPGTR
jgi:hypothetical protein